MPNAEEVQAFQKAFSTQCSTLGEIYTVPDGLELHVEHSDHSIIQEMFYNGWTYGHYVSNVFVFARNGKLFVCSLNAPGSMHDSVISEWGGGYDKLKEATKHTEDKL